MGNTGPQRKGCSGHGRHIWEHHKVQILLLLPVLSASLKLKWHFWKSSICITEPFSWVCHPKTSVTGLSLCQLAVIKISKDYHMFPYWTVKVQGWEEMKKNQQSGDSSISSNATGNCRFWSGISAGIPIFYGSGSFCCVNYFCIFLLLPCISLPTSLGTCFGSHDHRVVKLKIPFWKLIFPSPLLTHELLPKSCTPCPVEDYLAKSINSNQKNAQVIGLPSQLCLAATGFGLSDPDQTL